ncbi:hypothetical protein E4T50_02180 [Aureobasidium sp. EXF-12298]|nr:hypothetical protein E4T50_02180 [Aureobasidium sp. EXF-12298]
MTASNSGIPAAINSGIVEMPSHDVSSEEVIATIDDSDHNKNRRRFCFAPTEQAYNHGSDRVRRLRTMPFDSETWIGNLDNLGSRVWPHPSFNELLARSLTGDPRFPLPNTVAKENRFQSLRLRCCGEECLPTTHSPPVEYEKPSPLETLAFERTQNAGLQRLFAIVHRHENGRYRFWKADGTYHEFYGLVKGSISMFPSPRSARSTNIGSLGSPERRSTSTSTKSSKPVAQFAGDLDDTTLQVAQEMRTLTRSGNMEGQLVSGQVEVPFADCPEPPSKRRIVAGSYVPHGKEIDFAKVSHIATPRSMAKPKQLRFRRPSATSARHSQPSHIRTQGPVRSLLHIKEACMLAYHLTGPALQLMYGNHAFTIESREGSLIDPTTDDPFLMTEQHAQYVLYSRQRSLKVILSKEITRSINESADRMTGGVVLLEFGGSDARDDFIASIKYMVGTVGGIGCADE